VQTSLKSIILLLKTSYFLVKFLLFFKNLIFINQIGKNNKKQNKTSNNSCKNMIIKVKNTCLNSSKNLKFNLKNYLEK
jgi:hypothetical protein